MKNGILWSLVLSLLLASCSDERESYYHDYNSMKASDSYQKGWIPDIIPESATSIYEKHELDNNQVWIELRCNPSDLIDLADSMSIAYNNEPLVKAMKKDFDLSDSISFYLLSDKEVIGIDSNIGHLYYYRSKY